MVNIVKNILGNKNKLTLVAGRRPKLSSNWHDDDKCNYDTENIKARWIENGRYYHCPKCGGLLQT